MRLERVFRKFIETELTDIFRFCVFSNVGNMSYQDGNIFSVEFHRGERGFGFSIRGGKEFQNMPLFVLRLAENGPAAEDGRMQVTYLHRACVWR